MKKEYRIPKIRTVQLSDRICLGVASDGTIADPYQPAGAKKRYDFPGIVFYEDEDGYEYEDIYE